MDNSVHNWQAGKVSETLSEIIQIEDL